MCHVVHNYVIFSVLLRDWHRNWPLGGVTEPHMEEPRACHRMSDWEQSSEGRGASGGSHWSGPKDDGENFGFYFEKLETSGKFRIGQQEILLRTQKHAGYCVKTEQNKTTHQHCHHLSPPSPSSRSKDSRGEEEAEAISLARNNGSKEEIEMWPDSEYIQRTEPREIDSTLEEDVKGRGAKKVSRIWMGTSGRMELSFAETGSRERASLS